MLQRHQVCQLATLFASFAWFFSLTTWQRAQGNQEDLQIVLLTTSLLNTTVRSRPPLFRIRPTLESRDTALGRHQFSSAAASFGVQKKRVVVWCGDLVIEMKTKAIVPSSHFRLEYVLFHTAVLYGIGRVYRINSTTIVMYSIGWLADLKESLTTSLLNTRLRLLNKYLHTISCSQDVVVIWDLILTESHLVVTGPGP